MQNGSPAEAAYGEQRANGWSRIDMLLALYESGINKVKSAIEATEAGDQLAANNHRLRTMKVVQGIAAGLDIDDSEVVNSIASLCEFMSHALEVGSMEQLLATEKVLITLRDGFKSIRAEAVALEKNGDIPPIDSTSAFQFTV